VRKHRPEPTNTRYAQSRTAAKKPSFKTKSKCTLLCDSRDRLKLDHLQNVLDLLSYYMIHIGLTVTFLSIRH